MRRCIHTAAVGLVVTSYGAGRTRTSSRSRRILEKLDFFGRPSTGLSAVLLRQDYALARGAMRADDVA